MKAPLIIAHRGDSVHAPENTLSAFRLALEKGADGVEFDVQLSKDSVPVVIHDYDLKRTAGRPDSVADLTAEQLGGLDVGSWFSRKKKKRCERDFSDQTVPTLAEVLDVLTGCTGPIYIELKCLEHDYEALARIVCDAIRSSPQRDQMIIKSFRLAAIAAVRCSFPEVRTAALFAPEILNFVRRKRHIIDLAREFGATDISVHYSLATPKLTTLAHKAQLPVTIWTADNPTWVSRCIKRNIWSLITNDPAKQLAKR